MLLFVCCLLKLDGKQFGKELISENFVFLDLTKNLNTDMQNLKKNPVSKS